MPPPSKRPRAEAEASEIVRSRKIWFHDGNVVLQAESTQFRLHWSVLSVHSTFFSDLHDLPQPSNENNVDGCPVISLPDSLQDVEHLLHALYDRFYHSQNDKPFPVLAAFLRLGRKYDFMRFRDEALQELVQNYPRDLMSWDLRKCIFKIKRQPEVYMDVVNLAREMNVFTVLPGALYECIMKSTSEEIFNGIERDDGSISVLSPDDQRLCILAREKILVAQSRHTLRWLDEGVLPSNNCTNHRGCTEARNKLRYITFQPVPSFVGVISWDNYTRQCKTSSQLCEVCNTLSKSLHDIGRVDLWENLPSFFGLPPWGELTNLE